MIKLKKLESTIMRSKLSKTYKNSQNMIENIMTPFHINDKITIILLLRSL